MYSAKLIVSPRETKQDTVDNSKHLYLSPSFLLSPLSLPACLPLLTTLSIDGHYEVLSELPNLVLISLHLDDGPGSIAVRGYDGVTLPCDAELTLHLGGVWGEVMVMMVVRV